MNIFKKYYTCDVVEDGEVLGSGIGEYWFWKTPIKIHKHLDEFCKEINLNAKIFNFRRVK